MALVMAAGCLSLSAPAQTILPSQTGYLNDSDGLGIGTPGTSTYVHQTTYGGANGGPPFGFQDVADGTAFITVAKYDPSQHEYAGLLSVKISLKLDNITQNYTFTNTGTTTSSGFVGTFIAFGDIYAPGTTTPVMQSESVTTTVNSPTLAANGGTTSGTQTPTDVGSSATYSSSPQLALYTGSGNVSFDIVGDAASNSSGGNGNTNESVTTVFGAEITIQYTIQTVVPEPGSWAFMGIGVITSGLFLRRRRMYVLTKTAPSDTF